MIGDETVFILGAGASAPYGYPIGGGLRDDICLNFKSDMSALLEKYGGRKLALSKLLVWQLTGCKRSFFLCDYGHYRAIITAPFYRNSTA